MSATVKPPQGSPEPPSAAADDATGRLEGASMGRVIAVLATIVLFSEIVPLQYAMISTATPLIGQSFTDAGDQIAWSTIIIALVGGAISPLAGKLSDLHGKKKVLLGLSGFFLAGTVLCLVADDWTVFLVGRGLMGIGFAIPVMVFSLVRDLMPRKFVPIAIGVCATGLGLSAAAAPILSGVLTDHYSWRSLFWFLLIYMIVLFPALMFLVPESKLRVKEKLDLVGSVLLGGGLALFLVYISNGETWGWGKPTSFGYAVGGAALLGAFYLWEKRVEAPIMDMKLLMSPTLLMILAAGMFANVLVGAQNYFVSFVAQTPDTAGLKQQVADVAAPAAAQAQGLPAQAVPQIADALKLGMSFDDPLDYALGFSLLALALHMMLWQSLASMVTGPLGGLWGQRRGLRAPFAVGIGLMTLSMALYAMFQGSWLTLMIIGVVWGTGFGLYYAAGPNLVIEAVPQEQQGVSTGMLNVANSFGAAVGAAVAGTVLAGNKLTMTMQTPGGPVTSKIAQVYTGHAYVLGFWIMAAIGVVALVLVLVMKAGRTPATGGLAAH